MFKRHWSSSSLASLPKLSSLLRSTGAGSDQTVWDCCSDSAASSGLRGWVAWDNYCFDYNFCCQFQRFQSVETRTSKSKESKEICLQHYSNSYFSQDPKYVCLGFGKLKHNWHSNSAGGIKMILIRQVILRQLILQYCEVVLFDLRTSISMFHCPSDRIMSRVLTLLLPINDFSGRVHIIVQ